MKILTCIFVCLLLSACYVEPYRYNDYGYHHYERPYHPYFQPYNPYRNHWR